MSAIEPGPWWPAIGIPLTAVMSTASPSELAGALRAAAGAAPSRTSAPRRSAAGPTPTGTRASPARACRPARLDVLRARRRADAMPASCSTCCSSCCFDSSSTCPARRRGRQERVLALGPEDRACSRVPPSRRGSAWGRSAARPLRPDGSGRACAAGRRRARRGCAGRRAAPTWPSTVPAITCTPAAQRVQVDVVGAGAERRARRAGAAARRGRRGAVGRRRAGDGAARPFERRAAAPSASARHGRRLRTRGERGCAPARRRTARGRFGRVGAGLGDAGADARCARAAPSTGYSARRCRAARRCRCCRRRRAAT